MYKQILILSTMALCATFNTYAEEETKTKDTETKPVELAPVEIETLAKCSCGKGKGKQGNKLLASNDEVETPTDTTQPTKPEETLANGEETEEVSVAVETISEALANGDETQKDKDQGDSEVVPATPEALACECIEEDDINA